MSHQPPEHYFKRGCSCANDHPVIPATTPPHPLMWTLRSDELVSDSRTASGPNWHEMRQQIRGRHRNQHVKQLKVDLKPEQVLKQDVVKALLVKLEHDPTLSNVPPSLLAEVLESISGASDFGLVKQRLQEKITQS